MVMACPYLMSYHLSMTQVKFLILIYCSFCVAREIMQKVVLQMLLQYSNTCFLSNFVPMLTVRNNIFKEILIIVRNKMQVSEKA